MDEKRLVVHKRMVGASWYISTAIEDGRIVVYVRSKEDALRYSTESYDSIPITFIEVQDYRST
jgi:hypothetical protein